MDEKKGGVMGKNVAFIVEQAKKEIASVTNLDLSTVLGIIKEGEEWLVTLEMVEKRSIPDSMDLLGVYETRLNTDGELINFNRIALRKRGDTNV